MMTLHWKRLAIELILELLMQLAPTSLDVLGAIAEYVVGLAEETQASIQWVMPNSGEQYHLPPFIIHN